MTAPGDVLALLRTRSYLVLLVVAGVLGAPIAAVAYWFLYLVDELQKWLYNPDYLLQSLGFHGEPTWWPIPLMGVAGGLVAEPSVICRVEAGIRPRTDFTQVELRRFGNCRASPWPP